MNIFNKKCVKSMSDKFENLLNLALETDVVQRQQSRLLHTGYNQMEQTWEVIIKYHGSLDSLSIYGITVEYLIAGYAILTVPEGQMERLIETEEVEYVEIPKSFFYQVVNPSQEPCIQGVTNRAPFLGGTGVLIAVLDSGITIESGEFQKSDGSTRIRAIWDQGITKAIGIGTAPEGFGKGIEITGTQINEVLQYRQDLSDGNIQRNENMELLSVVGRDTSGHGTAVAGIAAGSRTGVAKECELLIVKMDSPQTADVMRAITYALQKAREYEMPLVINLSLGNTYGSHDGSSLVERFLDNAAEIGRTVICVGSGNEGSSGGHFRGRLAVTDTRGIPLVGNSAVGGQEGPVNIEIGVEQYQTGLSIQLWKNYQDSFDIYLEAPGGRRQILDSNIEQGKYEFVLDNTRVLAYLGEPLPYSVNQEVFLDLLPEDGNYINSGIWRLILLPREIRVGVFSIYLPSYVLRNQGTRFLMSSASATLTIPSTAAKVITVGAYNSEFESYADFSGRGLENAGAENIQTIWNQKPDLVAPGVDILAPDTLGGYTAVTGTSFATPIVSGSAALLMEWGIVRGNDPYLYGEKLKAYLRSGAGSLRGEGQYPNALVGYGLLCTLNALPRQ